MSRGESDEMVSLGRMGLNYLDTFCIDRSFSDVEEKEGSGLRCALNDDSACISRNSGCIVRDLLYVLVG